MNTNKKYIYLNNWNGGSGLNDVKDRFTEYIKLTLSGPNTWEWDKFVPFLHI